MFLFVLVHFVGGENISLNYGHQRAYYLFSGKYTNVESNGGMILTGENVRTRRKSCPSAILSTTNPTWTDRVWTRAFVLHQRRSLPWVCVLLKRHRMH